MRLFTNVLCIGCLVCGTLQAQESASERSEAIYASGYEQFRIGGYGEVVANFKDYGINRFYGGSDGNTKKHRNTISIPRFVLALDYKFNSQ